MTQAAPDITDILQKLYPLAVQCAAVFSTDHWPQMENEYQTSVELIIYKMPDEQRYSLRSAMLAIIYDILPEKEN